MPYNGSPDKSNYEQQILSLNKRLQAYEDIYKKFIEGDGSNKKLSENLLSLKNVEREIECQTLISSINIEKSLRNTNNSPLKRLNSLNIELSGVTKQKASESSMSEQKVVKQNSLPNQGQHSVSQSTNDNTLTLEVKKCFP